MYVFIKKEDDWYAVDSSRIETRPLADCYTEYGQRIGHVEAGDWLHIDTQEAADAVFKYICETKVPSAPVYPGEWISPDHGTTGCYADCNMFEHFMDHPGFSLEQVGVNCVCYWDGHNWQTAFLSDADGMVEAEEIEYDEKVIRALRAAIGYWKQFSQKTTYGTKWRGKRFVVSTSNYANAWWDFQIQEI